MTARRDHKIVFSPIGIVHSPYTDPRDMPIQPAAGQGVTARVEVFPEFQAGLKDLDGFSHVILLYHFHRNRTFKLQVVPFMDDQERGVFATRAPSRPNGIGLSIVELDRIEGGVLHVRNIDILDGTPLLDIKPYVPAFQPGTEIRTGWLKDVGKTVHRRLSDDRFL